MMSRSNIWSSNGSDIDTRSEFYKIHYFNSFKVLLYYNSLLIKGSGRSARQGHRRLVAEDFKWRYSRNFIVEASESVEHICRGDVLFTRKATRHLSSYTFCLLQTLSSDSKHAHDGEDSKEDSETSRQQQTSSKQGTHNSYQHT